MAPSLVIHQTSRAASPVTSTGDDVPDTLSKKIIEDTTALMRSITTARGRNAEWAESTITDAEAATAQEALDLGVIDGIASSIALASHPIPLTP